MPPKRPERDLVLKFRQAPRVSKSAHEGLFLCSQVSDNARNRFTGKLFHRLWLCRPGSAGLLANPRGHLSWHCRFQSGTARPPAPAGSISRDLAWSIFSRAGRRDTAFCMSWMPGNRNSNRPWRAYDDQSQSGSDKSSFCSFLGSELIRIRYDSSTISLRILSGTSPSRRTEFQCSLFI